MINLLREKHAEYDELFESLYDLPMITAQVVQYAKEIRFITKEMVSYNQSSVKFNIDKNKEIAQLKKKLEEKQKEMDFMFGKLKQLRHLQLLQQD